MLKIGWSRRDVSTNEPVYIPGQHRMRLSKGILDPIMLNCTAIGDESDIAFIMSGDFVSPGGVIDEIRAKIRAARPDFPAEKILYSVTHTHAGAFYGKEDSRMEAPHAGMEIMDFAKYRDFFTTSAAECVMEAYDSMEEGAIAYGYGFAVAGHHRRAVYKDDLALRPDAGKPLFKSLWIPGHAKMYGNTNDDMFDGYEGVVDHIINILFTFDKDETLTGAILNVPCPSQNMENEEMLSADFWHDVRTIIRKKYGDIGIVSQCAAGGDMAPRMLHYKAAEKRRYALKYSDYEMNPDLLHPDEMYKRMEIAGRICEAFDEVYAWAKKDIIKEAPVRHIVRDIDLERRMITEEEEKFVREDLAAMEAEPFRDTGDTRGDFVYNTTKMSGIIRHRNIIQRCEEQKKSKTVKNELHVIRIGDIAFASNAHELFIDFQHRIQARSPFVQTFIVQLSAQPDGYPAGYLCTKRAEANVGYSATMFCNQVAPEGGDTLVEETVKDLKKLYE